MSERSAYGGQAVVEGVMIRGKTRVAAACRRPDGTIALHREEADTLTRKYRWLALPFLRGTPALIDSMRLGYRTLMWSADQAMEGEVTEKPQPKPSPLILIGTFIFSMAFAWLLFVFTPTLLTNYLLHPPHFPPGTLWWQQLIPSRERLLPNLFEGLLRLLFLVVYIIVIGRSKDIKRIFAYHGAEHKVVNAYEMTGDISLETAKRYSRIHPRCGTNFLFLFIFVAIIVHALIGWPENRLLLYASRIVLIIPIAGIAYELIRLAGKMRNTLVMDLLIWPGLLLQRLTTAEPKDDQIEVALTSMRTVLEDEGEIEPEPVADTVPETIEENSKAE